MLILPSSLLNVPDIRQQDNYSCGAACAMAVGKYFGVGPESLDGWKHELHTDVEESTRPLRIVGYLRQLGLDVSFRDMLTLDDLTACWCAGRPVICPIQEYGVASKQASFEYGHYVVVIGRALGHTFVGDPSIDNVLEGEDADQAPGRMLITDEKFADVWHDRDADGNLYVRFGIIVGPQAPTVGEILP